MIEAVICEPSSRWTTQLARPECVSFLPRCAPGTRAEADMRWKQCAWVVARVSAQYLNEQPNFPDF